MLIIGCPLVNKYRLQGSYQYYGLVITKNYGYHDVSPPVATAAPPPPAPVPTTSTGPEPAALPSPEQSLPAGV